jgi:hypothetical protein
MGGAVPPLPNTPSWRGAQGEHRDFTFTLPPWDRCTRVYPALCH